MGRVDGRASYEPRPDDTTVRGKGLSLRRDVNGGGRNNPERVRSPSRRPLLHPRGRVPPSVGRARDGARRRDPLQPGCREPRTGEDGPLEPGAPPGVGRRARLRPQPWDRAARRRPVCGLHGGGDRAHPECGRAPGPARRDVGTPVDPDLVRHGDLRWERDRGDGSRRQGEERRDRRFAGDRLHAERGRAGSLPGRRARPPPRPGTVRPLGGTRDPRHEQRRRCGLGVRPGSARACDHGEAHAGPLDHAVRPGWRRSSRAPTRG